MTIANQLSNLIKSGVHRIGQLEIQTSVSNESFIIFHHADASFASQPEFGGLEKHQGPADARDLSTYAEDGTYRFTKGQTNLKRGWVMILENEEELRLALDQFYPACVGLFLAQKNGSLEVENLRDKLNRQTGMYRFARSISDAGAQKLVQEVCGPAHQCAKKILWKLDPGTPLDDSEASRFNGIPGELPANEAIPLLCREACNHFVAECRKVAKAEFEAK
jgi:sirohydrochlorin cobaltochelatase